MIDYVCSWGPGILGHADPHVIEKVMAACEDGLTFRRTNRAGSEPCRTTSAAGSIHGSKPSGKFRNRSCYECHPCSAEGLQRETRSSNPVDVITVIRTDLLVKAGSGALTTSVTVGVVSGSFYQTYTGFRIQFPGQRQGTV